MKVAEITEFSAGVCGVWTRVLSESKEFRELGHTVRVFSSNLIKGTDKETDVLSENIKGIEVRRFKSEQGFFDKFLSKNVSYFNFEKELLEYKPDLVITHLIHPHSFKALRVCLKNKIPCYLVTHAPFNVKRKFPLNVLTSLYYWKIKRLINKFTKVVAITNWELSYLKKLGIEYNKIRYIPNGIPEEFFLNKVKNSNRKKEVLFLGRIAPVKNIETLIEVCRILPNVKFSIVGPAEQSYLDKIKKMSEGLKNFNLLPPVYNLNEKIKLIDEHKIFVLPSFREAMPQVLLEAMARGKIVISSNTDGGKEIINDGKNGFLFEIGNSKKLADLINKNLKGNKKIEGAARKFAEGFSWKKLIKRYSEVFS